MIELDQTSHRTETIEGTKAPREDEMGMHVVDHRLIQLPITHNDKDEGKAESEYKEARVPDRFPCFARRLLSIRLPYKFKPSNHSKYYCKTEPNQWLCIYSQLIELASGDDDLKTLFFPMALEAVPL
jgi:hypothetical protein